MNMKLWLPLGLAVVTGSIAAKVGLDMVSAKRPAADPSALTQIVVAAGNLDPGHQITETDLKIEKLAANLAPAGGFHTAAELSGRVVASPIIAGQTIVEPLLVASGAAGGVQALVPPGMRAITLEVNETSGVAGLLNPGCRVDVMVTVSDTKTREPITRTIVENTKVIAVGQRLGAAGPQAPGEPQNLPRSVTVIASPEQAQAIELATNTGRARLVLRGTFDKGSAVGRGMTVSDLLNGSDTLVVERVQPTTNPAQIASATTRPFDEGTRRHMVQVIRAATVSEVELTVPRDSKAAGTKLESRNLSGADTSPTMPNIEFP